MTPSASGLIEEVAFEFLEVTLLVLVDLQPDTIAESNIARRQKAIDERDMIFSEVFDSWSVFSNPGVVKGAILNFPECRVEIFSALV